MIAPDYGKMYYKVCLYIFICFFIFMNLTTKALVGNKFKQEFPLVVSKKIDIVRMLDSILKIGIQFSLCLG